MGLVENFEDLRIWQESRRLVREIYVAFMFCKDYSFRDQIQRSVISIMNNISEGFERRTKKDFSHFLDIAKGSSAEVKSMMYVAEDLQYLSPLEASVFRECLSELIISIGALASKLRKQESKNSFLGSINSKAIVSK
jgi:four helix bundle protein